MYMYPDPQLLVNDLALISLAISIIAKGRKWHPVIGTLMLVILYTLSISIFNKSSDNCRK